MNSDLQRLLQQIDEEYAAAQRGLNGLSATSRHDFIQARYRKADMYYEELVRAVGEEKAISILYERQELAFEDDSPEREEDSANE
ncbi:MAG: hypothetical protein ACJ788_27530 [Ktedonobacteraceae bacterium]